MGLRSLAGILTMLAGSLQAQICDLTFTTCPDKLPGSITVPLDVVSLDVKIPYCPAVGQLVSTTTPSIMFVIDNSGSMNNLIKPSDATDPTNARFTVVADLLDSIYKSNSNTKVGFAAFSSRLSFDYRDNKLFQPLFPGDNSQHDSFVPLMPLDSTFGDGGKRALDTLKALLKFDKDGNLKYNTTRNMERFSKDPAHPNPHRNGTDITLGFQAALKAMQSSTSPKEAQFIIFLSDGEASIQDEIRVASKDVYLSGTNTPTTFTVFFNPKNNATPLVNMTTMTNNIKANNYSTTNPTSALYNQVSVSVSELKATLLKNVLNQILYVPTIGKSVTVGINGGQTLKTTTKADSTHFLLSTRLPLNAGSTQMTFSYVNSYKDTTVTPALVKDTTMSYNLVVNRSGSGTIDGTLAKACREQPTLGLYAAGTPLNNITTSQINLEARLTIPAGSPACAPCTVDITPSKSLDKETVALTTLGTYLGGPFVRTESTVPVPGDGTLQHLASDSIVLTWVDPLIPLNVVRKAYPYQLLPSTLELYANGKKLDTLNSSLSEIEVRLTRAPTAPCVNCTVQVSSMNGTDKETIALKPAGASFNGMFVHIESITPIAADGKLQHLSVDSIVIVWTNPENPQDMVRRSYPFMSLPPSLALFSGGKAVDTITAANGNLEARLTLPNGVECKACTVKISSINGLDQESLVLTGTASPYRGSFSREVNGAPGVNNGKLEHAAKDSIVLVYQNPLNPTQQVRVSYLYVDFANIIGIVPHNTIARTGPSSPISDGRQWIISDAPSVVVQTQANGGACCRILATPANSASPDSASNVGIIVEASREFTLELSVYSNLGEFVNRVNFTVPRTEFLKLSPVPGKETRYMRLLWNGLTENGARAGTGVYVFKTTMTLLPIPGIVGNVKPVTSIRRLGISRRD